MYECMYASLRTNLSANFCLFRVPVPPDAQAAKMYPWRQDVQESIDLLEVKADGWEKAHEWNEVRLAEVPMRFFHLHVIE